MSSDKSNLEKNEKTILKGLDIKSSRFDGQALDPEDLTVVGNDPGTGPDDYLYDPRATRNRLDPLTMESIDQLGVLDPPIVIRDGNKIIVADGIGRTLMLRAVNKKRVARGDEPYLMRCLFVPKGTSRAEIDAMKTTVNVHRLAENAVDLADKLYAFVKAHGESQMHLILTAMRITAARAEELLALRTVAPVVRQQVVDGNLGVEAAIALSKLGQSEQAQAAEDVTAIAAAAGRSQPSAELVREYVQVLQKPAPPPPPAKAGSKGTKATAAAKPAKTDGPAMSRTMAKMLYRYADEHGWPGNPNGVLMLGAFIGESSLNDIPGGSELFKAALADAKKKQNKSKTPEKKTTSKKGK